MEPVESTRTSDHRPRPKEIVSYNMSKVKRSGSKIERLLGQAMFALGLRYRKQDNIFGRPDFSFRGVKIAVFCDSNFWHGKNWEKMKNQIKTNREFWIPKIEGNIERDRAVNIVLEREGWMVIRFWEDEIILYPDYCALMVKNAVDTRREER